MKPKKGDFSYVSILPFRTARFCPRTAGLTYTNKSQVVLQPIARTLLYQEE